MTEFSKYQEAHRDDPLYVILGVQGSGTNLLSNLMGTIFQFSVTQDRCLIFDAAAGLLAESNPANVRKQFERLHRSLFPGPIRKRLVLKHYHHRNEFFVSIEDEFAKANIQSAAEFADFVYDYRAFSSGKPRKAIKSDDLWQRIGQIEAVLPNRRYVLLVRDGRDNALSIMNKNFGPRDIYAASAYVQRRLNIYQDEIRNHTEPSLELKYETLLTNPREFVGQFSEAFQIDPVSDWENKLETFPIRAENFDKWRKLPARGLAVSEAVLKNELTAFGYELVTDGQMILSQWQRMLWRLKDGAMRIPQRMEAMYSTLINT